ncbi:MAG: hypothetical protein KAS88_03200 [Deltaproteobacteria bacterium]|nr:hypothetical protein [Deltaproteobacteria bacterium]
MKKLMGLIIMVVALTLIVPVASSASDTRERRTQQYSIDYAIRTLDSVNRGGGIYNGGVYTTLSMQLRKAKRLVARENVGSAKNVLNATVKLLDAQSGNKISERGAYTLSSVITRIRL